MSQPATEPAVIFLHHFGGSSRTWDDVIARLPGVRCIAPDLRGFGASDISDASCNLSDYASDVRRLLTTTGVDRFVLVGHSMGGKIAMAAVAGGLPGIEALLLLAPSPPTPEPISDEARAKLASTLDRAAGAEVVSEATARPLSSTAFDKTVADIHRSAPAAWRAWLESGSREDISPAVDAINLPTTVLSGSLDRAIPTAVVQKQVVARIRGARFSIIPGVGHLLPLEAPAAVANAILNVLNLRARRQAASRGDGLEKNPASTAPLPVLSYPRGFVSDLLNSDAVRQATRRALTARAAPAAVKDPEFFTTTEMATLRAMCARLIPQPTDRPPLDMVTAVDERLARGKGNGWRYAAMPPDGEFYRRSLQALDETARHMLGQAFARLDIHQQDRLLLSVQYDEVRGGLWTGLSPRQFIEELLAEISEVYFSHPLVQNEIGYAGMADARGWTRIGLDQLHDIEPGATRSTEAPRA